MTTLTRLSLLLAIGLSLGCKGKMFSENIAGKYKTKLEAGLANFDAGALPEAQADFTAALEAAQKLGDGGKATVALQNLAAVALRQGKNAEAKTHAAQAAELVAKTPPEDTFLPGVVNLQLGKAAMYQADFPMATQALDAAIAAFEKAADAKEQLFDALLNKGILLQTTGKHPEAQAAYRKAVEFERSRRKIGEETHELAAAYCEMGRNALDAGDLDAAGQHFDRANKILRSLRLMTKGEASATKPIESWVAANAARLLRQKDQPIKLAGVFQEALRNFEKLGRPGRETAFLHREYGRVLLDDKKYPQSEVELKKSLELCHDFYGPAHPELARSLEVYAALLDATGRSEEGAEARGKAKAILASVGQLNPDATRQQANAN